MLTLVLATLGLSQGPQSDTPGFAFLGAGYDLLSGNPLSTTGLGDPGFRINVFDWSFKQGLTTSDGKYKIADQTRSRPFKTCKSTMHSKTYNSAYTYKHMINVGFNIGANIGFKGPKGASDNVNFEFGIDVRKTRNHTNDRSRIYAQASAVCTAYQLIMNQFFLPNVTENFERGVAMMPVAFDMDAYASFLRAFGTHYVTSMKVGGRFGMQMTFKSNKYQALIDNNVNVNLGIHAVVGAVSGGFGINVTNDRKTQYKISDAIYENSTFSIGGTYSPDSKTWMASVRESPMPVYLTLTRLDALVNQFSLPNLDLKTLPAKKANIIKAINGYCAYQEKLNPGFNCTPQGAIPMPTPAPISAKAIRRICIQNSGGYALFWHMTVGTGNGIGAQSDTYAAGNTECIDGSDVLAKPGDVLGCYVNAVAGPKVECGKPWEEFSYQSTLQANYKCTGAVNSPSCIFNGLTRIGGEGGGGRRL